MSDKLEATFAYDDFEIDLSDMPVEQRPEAIEQFKAVIDKWRNSGSEEQKLD